MGGPPESNAPEPFGPDCRNEIGNILRLSNDPKFPEFWDRISASGKSKRHVLEITPTAFTVSPFDVSATQRITWLERNILHPAKKLEHALAEENKPFFVHWESELLDRRGPYLPQEMEGFSSSLTALRDQVEALIRTLETDVDQKIKSSDEFRFSIVFDALHDLHDFFPDFPLSRGNWDPELRETIGIVPEFVRRIFLETTGEYEQLDSPIKIAIDDIRRSQNKSS